MQFYQPAKNTNNGQVSSTDFVKTYAKLNDAQKQALNNWIDKIQDRFVEEY